MQCTALLHFGPFVCDPGNACLRRAEQVIHLTPKAFAVLSYLLERAGQLAAKDEILQVVWPETTLSETVLAVAIRELRRALQDSARTPQFIETIHRRGYRFIATLQTIPSGPTPLSTTSSLPGSPLCIGRSSELARLDQWLMKSLGGERQIGFIAGETGIGKTALVQAFVERVQAEHTLWVGYGQCVEQYGTGEAYLPILQAMGQLGREPEGQQLIAILRHYAPTCLMQLPVLHNATADTVWPYQEGRATQERMLREMAEAIEVLTTVRPFILVLEDLHWSDAATLSWLAYVARRVAQARLLILGTYRPMDVLVQGHPLYAVKHELHIHGQCDELMLQGLTEAEVLAYLTARYGERVSLEVLPRVIHRRTNGNPLFMALLTEALSLPEDGLANRQDKHWRGKGHEVAWYIPESLRQLIELQLTMVCAADQALLETASVVGVWFSAATVAAGMDCTVEDIETRLAALARQQQFVQHQGTTTWPDGTVAASYRFIHALYQEILCARVSVSRRVRLQQAIAAQREPW